MLQWFDKPAAGFAILAALCAITASAAEKADIIVAKDGSGAFTSIQAAINSVSSSNSKNVTILIKNGTYNEHIAIDKSFISLIGEDREKTIIQFSIEREQWSSTNGSTVGCAAGGWHPAAQIDGNPNLRTRDVLAQDRYREPVR